MTEPITKNQRRLIIIVLYRIDLLGAGTVQSILECSPLLNEKDKILIWDNSPHVQPDHKISTLASGLKAAVEYKHTPQNISLAKVYNMAVSEHPEYDFVFLFDQDSQFGQDYFLSVTAASVAHPAINLFVPLVRNSETIISPGHFYIFKGRYWSRPRYGLVKARGNVAIASGMAIRMGYLRQFGGFEEKLRLYGIDSNFMLRYARSNEFFYVLDVDFRHDLSDFNAESRDVKRRRFEEFKQGSLVNSRLFPAHIRVLIRLFLWYRSITF